MQSALRKQRSEKRQEAGIEALTTASRQYDYQTPEGRAGMRGSLRDHPEVLMELDKGLADLDWRQLQMASERAQAAKAQTDQYKTEVDIVSDAIQRISTSDPKTRAWAYPAVLSGLKRQGIKAAETLPPEWDDGAMMQFIDRKKQLDVELADLDLVTKRLAKTAAEKKADYDAATAERAARDQEIQESGGDAVFAAFQDRAEELGLDRWQDIPVGDRRRIRKEVATISRVEPEPSFEKQTYEDFIQDPKLTAKYGTSRTGFEQWQSDLVKERQQSMVVFRDERQNTIAQLPGDYGNALKRAVSGITSPTRRNFIIKTANSMADDPDELASYIRDTTIAGSGAIEGRQVTARTDAIGALTAIDAMLDELAAAGVDTNILTGTVEDVARKFGTSTDPRLVEIGARMQRALSAYTLAVSGVQFSESEAKRYEQLFPNYRNTMPVNKATIRGVRGAMEMEDRNFWERKLGKNGAALVVGIGGGGGGSGSTDTTTPPATDVNLDTVLDQFFPRPAQ